MGYVFINTQIYGHGLQTESKLRESVLAERKLRKSVLAESKLSRGVS